MQFASSLSLSRAKIFLFIIAGFFRSPEGQLDLAFNNVKPKDWYFVLD